MEFYHYSPSVTFVVQSPPQPLFWDVTQRYPQKTFFFFGGGGGAMRDIPKNGCGGDYLGAG